MFKISLFKSYISWDLNQLEIVFVYEEPFKKPFSEKQIRDCFFQTFRNIAAKALLEFVTKKGLLYMNFILCTRGEV